LDPQAGPQELLGHREEMEEREPPDLQEPPESPVLQEPLVRLVVMHPKLGPQELLGHREETEEKVLKEPRESRAEMVVMHLRLDLKARKELLGHREEMEEKGQPALQEPLELTALQGPPELKGLLYLLAALAY